MRAEVSVAVNLYQMLPAPTGPLKRQVQESVGLMVAAVLSAMTELLQSSVSAFSQRSLAGAGGGRPRSMTSRVKGPAATELHALT